LGFSDIDLSGINVLLAEDSRTYRKFVSGILIEAGCNLHEAANGAEAVHMIENSGIQFDLIVSDIEMPELDGIELAKYNYKNRLIPFIVITSTGDANKALELIRLGVQDYMLKPFEPRMFMSVVRLVVSRARLRSGAGAGPVEFDGNLASEKFPSTQSGLSGACAWIETRIRDRVTSSELTNLLGHIFEFLVNAHEHGNLGMTESDKGLLLGEGKYHKYLKDKEVDCNAKITLEISVVGNVVAVSISDEGKGFDFEKYMRMTDKDVLERISLPNGRGIIMAKTYFDSIKYVNNGSTIRITKSFNLG
jgi:CheY-like chemotaxis protein